MDRIFFNLARFLVVVALLAVAAPLMSVASASEAPVGPLLTQSGASSEPAQSVDFLANPIASDETPTIVPQSISPSTVPTTPGYVAVNPARLMDTRFGQSTVDGLATGGGALGTGATRDLVVIGRGGIPATGVAAVALNVTVTGPTASSYLTAWPAGTTRPLASNLNFGPGDTVPNMVTVKVGSNGSVSIYNNLGSVDVVVDVAGWYLTDAEYQPLVPARLMETRYGLSTVDGTSNGWGKIRSGLHADLTVLGRGGVPAANVSTVVLNVTVTGPTEPGYLTVWPTGEAMPLASNLNFTTNTTIPNLVVAKVGANGQVSIYNSSGWTDVVVDVLGWYQSDTVFSSLSPSRLMDTRSGQRTTDGLAAGGGAIASGATRTLQVTGRGGVPLSGVGAVALNVTVTGPSGSGYLTVWPSGTQQPLASNLNFKPGQTIPNSVVAKVGSGGQISIFNSSGNSDVVVDVLGWFTASVVSGPTAPQSVGVLQGHRFLRVSWAPSERNGGSPVTSYVATASPSGASCTTSPGATTCDITQLPYGVQQTVRVVTQNKIGLLSANSSAVNGTPFAVTSVSVGEGEACGTLSDGRAACWGDSYTWMGRGSDGEPNFHSGINYVFTAPNVPLENVTQVSIGPGFGCALLSNGHVWCWGYNRSGNIGIPTTRSGVLVNAPYAVEVSPSISDGRQIVVAGPGTYDYSEGAVACVLRSTGGVSCWGGNSGKLGDGSSDVWSVSPRSVIGISTATKIVASKRTVCALLGSGAVKCWGHPVTSDYFGTPDRTPQPTAFTSGVTDITLGEVDSGNSLCAVVSGSVKCLGTLERNLGTSRFNSPLAINGVPTVAKLAQGDANQTCALSTGSQVWCWGGNWNGVLRDGTTDPNEDPTQMPDLDPAMDVGLWRGETCVVPTQGGYECWGRFAGALQ